MSAFFSLLPLVWVAALAAIENRDGERWWSHVQFLASDELRGRETGSAEHRRAAEYVAMQFAAAGLEPAGTAGYIQSVPFRVRRYLEEKSSLALVRDGRPEPILLGDGSACASSTRHKSKRLWSSSGTALRFRK